MWQNSRDLLAVLDANGIFARSIRPDAAVLGYASHEVIGRNFVELCLARGCRSDAGTSEIAAPIVT